MANRTPMANCDGVLLGEKINQRKSDIIVIIIITTTILDRDQRQEDSSPDGDAEDRRRH